ncbi:tetratricopeptide repeat protein, partial [Rivularia sp. UHCC 0363]|uniref:tetratricopeptide repeat protein n=1 Tax=Rivularia sp. UHCC 0363 TaxID=3110244 RepID=UPI002B200ABB
MINSESEPSPEAQNQDAYEDLLTAITASDDRLSLLIAVCDDPRQRQEIIQRYESELSVSHAAYRVSMARSEPSLKLALQELMTTELALRQGEPAVITVLGIEQLSFWRGSEAKSQQDVFFGYLQWTREALREFRFPIVIWVTYQILNRLSRQSPDFWGWRKGVFRFASRTRAAIPAAEFTAIRDLTLDSNITDETLLPLADLETLIQQTAAQNPKSPLLASLYDQLGRVYDNRLKQGESVDYLAEQAKAIEYFQKAIQLLKELEQPLDLANGLNNLAELYRAQGRYSEAEPLYLDALTIRRSQLGAEHPSTATSLNNLAGLYKSQGRYAEA